VLKARVSHDQLLTDPDQAVDFVRATKVDALAIADGDLRTAPTSSRVNRTGGHPRHESGRGIHRRLPNTLSW